MESLMSRLLTCHPIKTLYVQRPLGSPGHHCGDGSHVVLKRIQAPLGAILERLHYTVFKHIRSALGSSGNHFEEKTAHCIVTLWEGVWMTAGLSSLTRPPVRLRLDSGAG